jgi:hypothetical protein
VTILQAPLTRVIAVCTFDVHNPNVMADFVVDAASAVPEPWCETTGLRHLQCRTGSWATSAQPPRPRPEGTVRPS